MNRKPRALRILEGNRSKTPISDEPSPYPVLNPRSPIGLSKPAKKTWRRLTPILSKLNLLTEADLEALGHLCEIQARLVIIREKMKETDLILEKAFGKEAVEDL